MTAALRGPPAETENPSDPGRDQEGFRDDEASRLPRIIDRLGNAKLRGEVMMGWLTAEHNRLDGSGHDSGAVDDLKRSATKLHSCGQLLTFHHYYTVGKLRLVNAFFCKQHLICPACAIRRASKLMARYLHKIELVRAERPGLKLALLTYTVKNGADLEERLDHLTAGLDKLKSRRRAARKPTKTGARRKRPSEWGAIVGAVGSIEVTHRPATGWHPHCHMLVLLDRYMSHEELRREWQEITGDSFIVDIRELDSSKSLDPDELIGDLAEVLKYSIKFSDLDPALTWHCRNIIARGRRLLFNLGALFGVPEPDELDDDPLEGLPYVEHLLKYRRGVGYAYTAAPRVVEAAEAEAAAEYRAAVARACIDQDERERRLSVIDFRRSMGLRDRPADSAFLDRLRRPPPEGA